MSFVYANLSVIVVALATGVLGWLYGGTRASVIADVTPWLILFLAQVLFFFPQKHSGETSYAARTRVWGELKHDPLVWVSFGLILLLAIPFVNTGLCVSCDRALIAEGHSPEPPFGFLPFCVNRLQHYNVFLWFAVALSAMLATKHCLVRRGKRLLLHMLVWNGFALAILGFIQIASGAEGPFWVPMANVKGGAGTFFSTFGYPNMAGDYFVTLFGLAVALWRDVNLEYNRRHSERDLTPSDKNRYKMFCRRHYPLIPAGLFFFAAISTLSRAAIILVTLMLVIAFFHSLISITHRLSKKERMRRGMISVLIVGLVAFFSIISIPEDVQREIDTLNTQEVLTRVTGKGQYHVRVATEIWRDHKLFGCGGWGYKHFCLSKMTPEEQLQMVGGINVHNDYLQFLAEHGLVGFGAMVAIVVLLLRPVVFVWTKLVKTARFTDSKRAPAKPIQIFALPAPAFLILATALATLVHGFGDCPLRSPAVLTLFFVSLAAIPGFLPKDINHAAR